LIGALKCTVCKHNITENIRSSEWKCDAFPNGIPEEKIMYITHDPCINCNNGIGFEPIDQKGAPNGSE